MNVETIKNTLENIKSMCGADLFQEALALLSLETKSTPIKPKRELSPEHLAALKAGREAARAKKQQEEPLTSQEEPLAAPVKKLEFAKKPSGWSLFCQRVALEIKSADLKLGEPLSVASHVAQLTGVKESKNYESVTTEQILAAAASFVAKPKAKKGSKTAPAPAAAPAPTPASEEEEWEAAALAEEAKMTQDAVPLSKKGPKKGSKWSDEAKAAAAAKRAAKKGTVTAVAVAAVAAVTAVAVPVTAVAAEVVIDGETYTVEPNGAAYRHDGLSKGGTYAGVYKEGVLDMLADEPLV